MDGNFAVFALVASCFILYDENSFNIKKSYSKFLTHYLYKKPVISLLAFFRLLRFYGHI